MNHTPGPWKVDNDGPDSFFIAADVGSPSGPWKMIAEVCNTDMASARCTSEEIEANARLIAVSPNLLESLDNTAAALETMLAHYGKAMPNADYAQRNRVLDTAKQLMAQFAKE